MSVNDKRLNSTLNPEMCKKQKLNLFLGGSLTNAILWKRTFVFISLIFVLANTLNRISLNYRFGQFNLLSTESHAKELNFSVLSFFQISRINTEISVNGWDWRFIELLLCTIMTVPRFI